MRQPESSRLAHPGVMLVRVEPVEMAAAVAEAPAAGCLLTTDLVGPVVVGAVQDSRTIPSARRATDS